MKGPFEFDPAQCEYGPATAAVRRVLGEWVAVDWFAPPCFPDAEQQARRHFVEHQDLGRGHAPDLFPAELDVRFSSGGWPDFIALCQRVREQSWDWKFSVLKQLSLRHSRAHGWSLPEQAPSLAQGARPGPGDLFFRFGKFVMWNSISPKLELDAALPRAHADAASWYLNYAGMDLIDCLEWQLSEGSDRLGGNPFLPLLRCYGAGSYPFSLGPSTVVLFSLQPPAASASGC